MHGVSRRTFLKRTVCAAAAFYYAPPLFAAGPRRARVVVVHGKDFARMVAAGVEALGGWSQWPVASGRVVIKPNAAWASAPAEGANTHPDLVAACVAACRAAGAREVLLPENPTSPAQVSFAMSGIAEAARKAGGRLFSPPPEDYVAVELPRAAVLKNTRVARPVLEADVLINLPVAKHHGTTRLTLGLKNWMGSVLDRGEWHRRGLHECIADFSTRIRPSLVIVDASRILLTNGPRGPGRLAYPERILLGTDPVAVDACAATLFDIAPFDVEHIRLAHEKGVGCGDLAAIELVDVRA